MILNVSIRHTGTSASHMYIGSSIIPLQTANSAKYCVVAAMSKTETSKNCFIIPVGSDHKISYNLDAKPNDYANIALFGYKRIGTNS